jgi:hypothetical protein
MKLNVDLGIDKVGLWYKISIGHELPSSNS